METSVANPVRPRYTSPYEKILGKLLDTVRACSPSRRSQAMATQSLPTMATQAPPSVQILSAFDLCIVKMVRCTDGKRRALCDN